MQNNTNDLRSRFLGWQCRIRQHAVRKQEGRPPQGIRASLKIGGRYIGQYNTVLNKREPEEVTAEFRFMRQKTTDHKDVYHNALKFLCEYYYQYPASFDDRLTALFSIDSEAADQIVAAENCSLGFYQANQRFTLQCRAELFPPSSKEYQATYWHNHLFNPNLPGVVKVAGFNVDWEASSEDSTAGQ